MYVIKQRVRYSEADHTKHLTLTGIVNYFQDCSTFQSEDIGLGIEFLESHKRGWVLSSWQIIVKRYPKIGENIEVGTWPTSFHGLYGTRNFVMKDECQFNLGIYGYGEKPPDKTDRRGNPCLCAGTGTCYGLCAKKDCSSKRMERAFRIFGEEIPD